MRSLLSLINKSKQSIGVDDESAATALVSDQRLLEKYIQYREISRGLCMELLKYISQSAIQICGKQLGIVKRKTLMISSEEEMSVLMNYCIFHFYIQDKNAVDRYLAMNQDVLSNDKKTVALAMQQADFSILQIEETLPYGGVLVTDILRNSKRELLIDKGFSKTTVSGLLLATTIVRYPQFIMSTGASLPLNTGWHSIINELESLMSGYQKKYGHFDSTSKMEQSKFIIQLLKACFRAGVSENIRYETVI